MNDSLVKTITEKSRSTWLTQKQFSQWCNLHSFLYVGNQSAFTWLATVIISNCACMCPTNLYIKSQRLTEVRELQEHQFMTRLSELQDFDKHCSFSWQFYTKPRITAENSQLCQSVPPSRHVSAHHGCHTWVLTLCRNKLVDMEAAPGASHLPLWL